MEKYRRMVVEGKDALEAVKRKLIPGSHYQHFVDEPVERLNLILAKDGFPNFDLLEPIGRESDPLRRNVVAKISDVLDLAFDNDMVNEAEAIERMMNLWEMRQRELSGEY